MSQRAKEPAEAGMTTTFFSAVNKTTRVRRVMLRVVEGPDKGSQIQVANQRITVGRSAVNDLVLTDSSVSGTHIEILLNDRKGILLRDSGSTNGTSVGGVRLREAWIEPGAKISLGKTVVEFLSADSVEVRLSEQDHYGAMWGASPTMREVFAVLEKIAPTEMNVLIGGETGCGKELVARALHDESPRAEKPFIVLDCGSLPRDLAEAAILGHKKGAFTGAINDRAGAFEDADGGTLFLDEIGELPLELQPKLLRVLDRREVQRIGETQVRNVDVRVVAATHRDLRKMVGQGSFREDLYFRLSVMAVDLPPLRDRGEDVQLLASRFLKDFERLRGSIVKLSAAAKAALSAEQWPGNVRELKNTIERAAYLAKDGLIEPSDLFIGRRAPAPRPEQAQAANADGVLPAPDYERPFKLAKQELLDVFEREYFKRLLAKTDHNLSRAAGEAGITRYYLRELLKRLGMHKVPAKKDKDEG